MHNRSDRPEQVRRTQFEIPCDFPVLVLPETRPSQAPLTYLHVHNALELGYCHEGAGVFVVEDKVQPYEAGDVSVINETELHLARSAAGTGSRWTFVLIEPIKLFGAQAEEELPRRTLALAGPGFRNVFSGRVHPEICHLMLTVLEEMEARQPGYRAVVRGRLLALVGEIGRLAPGGQPVPSPARASALERIAPALRRVAQGYDGPLPVGELARLCGASEPTLRRLFRAAVGRSPQEYVTAVRIQMSASLLRATDSSVLDIGLGVGYGSPSTFNRHFSRLMGMSPREWRKRAGGGRPA